jgi:U1 small nuclear ribonucleoprotein 70kDa
MGTHAGNRNRPAYSGQARFRFPPEIIALFVPRRPLLFKPPARRKKLRPMSGLSELVARLQNETSASTAQPASTEGAANGGGAVVKKDESITPAKRRAIRAAQDTLKVKRIVEERMREYDPHSDPDGKKTGNPFNTLFVGRLSKATTPSALRAEMEAFGAVVRVVMPKDRRGLPRGYGFVEYADERGLKTAYRDADGRRIDGRRIIVDVERGRTVKNWRPNRLDGVHNSAARVAARGNGNPGEQIGGGRSTAAPTLPRRRAV